MHDKIAARYGKKPTCGKPSFEVKEGWEVAITNAAKQAPSIQLHTTTELFIFAPPLFFPSPNVNIPAKIAVKLEYFVYKKNISSSDGTKLALVQKRRGTHFAKEKMCLEVQSPLVGVYQNKRKKKQLC